MFKKSFLYRSGKTAALIFPVSTKTNFFPVNLRKNLQREVLADFKVHIRVLVYR